MLRAAVALGALLGLASGDAGNNNNVNANYAVDEFSGAAFGFAMGTCNPDGLVPSAYWLYQCINTTHAWKHKYSKSTCRPSSYTGADLVTKNASQIHPTTGFLKCDGCDGYYAKVSFVADDCANSKAVLHASLNGCADLGDHNKSVSVWCNVTHAEMQYFGDSVCVDRSTYLYSYYADPVCSHMFDFTSKTQKTPIPIVSETTDCLLGSDVFVWKQWEGNDAADGQPHLELHLDRTRPGQGFSAGQMNYHTACHTGRPTPSPVATPGPTEDAGAYAQTAMIAGAAALGLAALQ